MRHPDTAQVPHKHRTSAGDPASGTQAADARAELQTAAGIAHRQHFIKEYLAPLLAAGLLEMTLPQKPNSPLQKYRATIQGLELMKQMSKEK